MIEYSKWGKNSTPVPNDFSIQLNTNIFPCTLCSWNVPFAAQPRIPNSGSTPEDLGWVQFVYSQTGTNSSQLCVANVDATIVNNTKQAAGYDTRCVNISDYYPIVPLFNPPPLQQYERAGLKAEVIGFSMCSGTTIFSPEPLPEQFAGYPCTLWAVAYIPWVVGPKWWAYGAPDELGLSYNGNWIIASGTMLGKNGGAEAVFYNTSVETGVFAWSCETSPTANPLQTSPGCSQPYNSYELAADVNLFSESAMPVTSYLTGETNNLTSGPVTFGCGNDTSCFLTYIATSPTLFFPFGLFFW
jgi:hypothetical protein